MWQCVNIQSRTIAIFRVQSRLLTLGLSSKLFTPMASDPNHELRLGDVQSQAPLFDLSLGGNQKPKDTFETICHRHLNQNVYESHLRDI